jgi:hypothetical protein
MSKEGNLETRASTRLRELTGLEQSESVGTENVERSLVPAGGGILRKKRRKTILQRLTELLPELTSIHATRLSCLTNTEHCVARVERESVGEGAGE